MEFAHDDPRGTATHTIFSKDNKSFANRAPEEHFATRLVSAVARRLVGRVGITRDDIPDLQQDLWLDLLERLPDYRPDRGHIRAFITRVAKNKVADILGARAAEKRGGRLQFVSLDEEHEDEDGDGETSNLHDTLSVDDYLRWTRGTVRSEVDRLDLELDVRKLVEQLPPHQRVACMLLIDRNACDVANVVGLPRSTLRDLIKRLRRICEEAEFENYSG